KARAEFDIAGRFAHGGRGERAHLDRLLLLSPREGALPRTRSRRVHARLEKPDQRRDPKEPGRTSSRALFFGLDPTHERSSGMRGQRNGGLGRLIAAGLAACCTATAAHAELGGTVTRTEPAGTLIMPFDSTSGKASFQRV